MADDLLSKNSVAKYKEIADMTVRLVGDISVKHLNGEMINKLKLTLNDRKLSSSRKNHFMIVVRNLLKFLKEDEGLSFYDYTKIVKYKVPVNEVKILSKEQLEFLISSLDGATTLARLRFRALVLSLISTGCRISELLDLNIQDVDLIGGIATVNGKGSKRRQVIFNKMAVDALVKYMEVRTDSCGALFATANTTQPKRWQKNDAERSMRNYGRKIGLGMNLHPHLLRRSSASLLYHQNAPMPVIKKYLGHSISSSATQKYYLGDIGFDEVQRFHESILSFDININTREEDKKI
ncbi:MAG: tyrosine-type recombinase/integrase [Candidatus Moraniibacteriota bacterium]